MAAEQTSLKHLSDVPPFEGGRTPVDCGLDASQQREMQGWEHRCVVLSHDETSSRLESHTEALRARGWTEGGAAGSGMWVLIPTGENCAQVYSIVASDYPRGPQTTDTSEIVLDLMLEQRARCGDERNLQ